MVDRHEILKVKEDYDVWFNQLDYTEMCDYVDLFADLKAIEVLDHYSVYK